MLYPTIRRSPQRRPLLLPVLTAVALAVFCVSFCHARKDRSQPHPHRGVLKPYSPGPFEIQLSRKDEDKLEAGQPVMKQTMPDKSDPDAGGAAICVQDVDAPPPAVWNQILDLNAYKGKVPKVLTSRNYVESTNKDGTSIIKTEMKIGVMPGYSYESYYDHVFHPKDNSLTWTLDYDKTSDFDDVSGHWHVEEHPTKPQASRVFYACDIKLGGNVPSPILNYISKAALKQATGWVKKESENSPSATPPAKFGVVSGAGSSKPVEAVAPKRFAFGRR